MLTKQMCRMGLLVVVATALVASVALAADEVKPSTVKLQGVVSVTADANNVITSVKLTAGDVVYKVVLDAKGLELGKTMKDVKVDVEGTVAEKNGKKLLTVLSFKRAE